VLILPPGHYKDVILSPQAPRRGFERWLVAFVAVVLAAGAVGLGISFTSHAPKSHDGCISVSAATPIGGSELDRCGAEARDLCAASEQTAQTWQVLQATLVRECRKAGLPTR